MEVESSSKDGSKSIQSRSRKRGIKICVLTAIAIILAVVILIVILAFTVFKPKRPVTTVNSVSVEDMNFSLDILRLAVNLNVTLNVDITIQNPNKVGFKFQNSSAALNYRGELVGEAPIPAGEISAGETLPMNLTLVILADRLLSNSKVYSDALSGTLPLSTYTRISGKVHIINLFRIRVVSYASCNINVDLMKQSVSNQTCSYRNKL